MQNWKNTILDAFIILAFMAMFAGVVHTLYPIIYPERPQSVPEPSPCEKIEGNVIVENQAGEYRYEVYATAGGTEIYKCNK